MHCCVFCGAGIIVQIKPVIKTLGRFFVTGIPCVTNREGKIVSLCFESVETPEGSAKTFQGGVETFKGGAKTSRPVNAFIKDVCRKLQFCAERENAAGFSEGSHGSGNSHGSSDGSFNGRASFADALDLHTGCTSLIGKPVSALWDLLLTYEDEVQGRIKNGVSYGVEFGFNKTSGPSCYIAGFPVKEESAIQKCFAKMEIPSQVYAVFPCTLSTLRKVYDYAYKEWLPNSSFQRMSGAEFELYDANFQSDNPNSVLYLYIPICKKF